MGPHDLQLIPARTLNEHVYWPPVAWIEWAERQFRHNADTAKGEHVQRRVDEERGRTPSADDIDLDAIALGGLSHFGLGLFSPEER